MPLPLLVFTDLDGTLLDHHSYDFSPALPAISALKQMGAGVVLASSKTAAEIAPLRRRLELDAWPAIVENGAGILEPGTDADAGDGDGDYRRLRDALAVLPDEVAGHFRGFGDMSAAEIAATTGLSEPEAARAAARQFSEPGLWHGSDEARDAFLLALQRLGISARSGGRFLTLSYGATKADRMRDLIRRLRPRQTLALGDAPNDVEMLETADRAFIVANPLAPPLPALPGESAGRILRTRLAGPDGWNAAVLGVLSKATKKPRGRDG